MRILWLSTSNGLYQYDKQDKGYNGIGWIASLQQLLQTQSDLHLGFVFLANMHLEILRQGNTTYYPIYAQPLSPVQKVKEYYGGYKRIDRNKYVKDIQKIIADFQPDLIHVFGMENPLITILGKTEIPIVVHIQGLLAPYDNAFFPVDFNKMSFCYPFSFREWIIRNGYIYAKKKIHIKGEEEKKIFKTVKYVMGRTKWDFQLSHLLAPQSIYFHVDEVLRNIFYEKAGQWVYKGQRRYTIVSTVSETIYKGFDLILKTAYLFASETNIKFDWKVIGVRGDSKFVRFFEQGTGVKSCDVNIKYLGILSAEEVCQCLLSSNVYVHPSYIDNSPNSICEAQMLGMPVISTNVGGIASLIEHDVNGLLIPANGVYELAYLLGQLCQDRYLCRKLGHNAFEIAQQRHNKNKILQDLSNCYNRIIQKDRLCLRN